MSSPYESVVTRVDLPDRGQVELIVEEVSVTEKEIQQDRDAIIANMSDCYNEVVSSMAPFQEQWDDSPVFASLTALREGKNNGVSSWASDAGDLFDGNTWSELGETIGDFAVGTYDMAADHAASTYNTIKANVNDTIQDAKDIASNTNDTLLNWGWWIGQAQDIGQQISDTLQEELEQRREQAESNQELAEDIRKVFQYRKEILALPSHIAEGNVNKVEHFVDTILYDIDRQLAEDIKKNPNYAASLELIADHDSILSYMTYFSMTMEAVPPNFYIYVGAKAGAYLAVEVVLMAVIGVLSAGAAVAARVGMIVARLAVAGAKVSQSIKNAGKAVSAFIRIFNDFILKITQQLHALGEKLVIARSKGVRATSSAGSKMTLRRKPPKREKGRCQLCKETEHPTPKNKSGVIEYD